MNTLAVAPTPLLEMINAGWTTQVLSAACELGLPDQLAYEPQRADVLARRLDIDADALQRLLHALVTLDVCQYADDDVFALGPLGHWLRVDVPGGLHHWARLNGGPLWMRWGALAERVRSGARTTGENRSALRFQVLDHDLVESRLFHRAMTELTARVADSVARALGPIDGCCVVDVGGGAGELLATVLATHPGAHGLLFDLPAALAHAEVPLRRHGVWSRCTLQPGSFFNTWPAGGDVYLLKSVLHDWDDAHAGRLLQRAREAMRPNARLVLVERLRADRPGPTPTDRATARTDLNMLVALSGRERRRAEFESLLGGSQFCLSEVHVLEGGVSLLVARVE